MKLEARLQSASRFTFQISRCRFLPLHIRSRIDRMFRSELFDRPAAIDLPGQRRAARGLGEGERDGILDIAAALGCRGSRAKAGARSRGAAAATAPAAEELLEDLGELAVAEVGGVELFDR